MKHFPHLAGLIRKAFFGLAALVLACHLGQDGKQVNTLTFTKHYESLSQYDSLVIVVKDMEGNLLDTIFSGKATKSSQLEKLEVAGWNGGPIQILLTGFKKGSTEPVYREEKHYDSRTRKTDLILVHLHPDIGISTSTPSMEIQEGRASPLPRVDYTPAHLADTALEWTSDNPDIAVVEGSSLVGISIGSTRITAQLRRDTTKTLTFTVLVVKSDTGGVYVSIDAPLPNSYTNQRVIKVAWRVKDIPQDSLLEEQLSAIGPNVITRSVRDSSGRIRSATITVYLDTLAPLQPILSGTSPTNTKPRWTWSSGGGGGSGDFRFRLGNSQFPADAQTTRDTAYTLADAPIPGTTYTLYVQERDLAGNWSPADSLRIHFEVNQPIVTILSPKASGTHYTATSEIILSGTATGGLPIKTVTYRIGAGAAANATFSTEAWSLPSLSLQEGSPLQVTVTAVDQAGNSGEASLTLFLDTTPPSAPSLTTAPATAIASLKGTFGWNPAGDGANGSGLNGRYRYSLNGGGWKDTTVTLLPDLPLVEGDNVFSVQVQDRAQHWSVSTTRNVRVDTTPPVISLSSHTNPAVSATATLTLSGQVRDTGTGVATMSVSGHATGNPLVTVAGANWTTAPLTLVTGPNTLKFTATDLVGNARTFNAMITVNLAASSVIITNPSDSLTLTRLDTIRVFYTIDGIPGNLRFDLVEGVNRLEVTSQPNASGNIGRDTVKVTRDAIPPRAPNLTAGATPTNAAATWTWTSRGDSANGAGVRNPPVFRYSVNGGAFVQTESNQHQIDLEGTYSLVVQEQDRAGNWSPSSTARAIVVDKSGPAIVIQTRNNYVTNRPRVYVQYTVDGNPAAASNCPMINADTSNTCTVSASDALGNRTNASIAVWYRPNIWFITPNGTGAGTSWDSASSDLTGFMLNQDVGQSLWVATGNYPDIYCNKPITLIGGFEASVVPYNSANRNLTGTFIPSIFSDYRADVTIDGIVSGRISVLIGKATLTDVQIEPRGDTLSCLSVSTGGSLVANNLKITGEKFSSSIIGIGSSTATFNGGSVVNNRVGMLYPIDISGPSAQVRFSNGFNVYGNISNETTYQVRVVSGAQLTVDNDVNLECWHILNYPEDKGSGTCKGNPL